MNYFALNFYYFLVITIIIETIIFNEACCVLQGWKPGAISKRLLLRLNRAKKLEKAVTQRKLSRKHKRRVEDKSTLIVCKKDGEYHIEVQVSPDKTDGECVNVEQCSPLIYKIAAENNQNKLRKRAQKQRRLIRKGVKEVWSDPYHPEICEKTCLKAYEQAIGVLPFDPNNPDCTCSVDKKENTESCSCCDDDDVSSDCSTLDLNWELHFTSPFSNNQ